VRFRTRFFGMHVRFRTELFCGERIKAAGSQNLVARIETFSHETYRGFR
jgi:hypothetical protein